MHCINIFSKIIFRSSVCERFPSMCTLSERISDRGKHGLHVFMKHPAPLGYAQVSFDTTFSNSSIVDNHFYNDVPKLPEKNRDDDRCVSAG